MTITIQVLSTSVETKPTAKGSYQQLEVAYKNLSFQGKVEAKKLMSFGANAEAFKVLSTAMPTSIWEVESIKNDKGYLDWTKVTKGESLSTTATVNATTASRGSSSTASQPSKGNWETPEERAKKQVYIVRQSSLNVAVTALTASAKAGTQPSAEDVIALAKQFEAYVFDTEIPAAPAPWISGIEGMDEDIPL